MSIEALKMILLRL